ncbi:MAG: hypothetical protein FJY73_10690 [Candidatus Eisenbacteria bacterium]|nr:hypothetical protein [Candidatus Eisenbacteria bacterium]
MRRVIATLFLSSLLVLPALATTGADLSNRIAIDGYSNDFEADEFVFVDTLIDVNGDGILEVVAQERDNDSKWGFNNDINQIKITWDNDNLYVAVDGISWDNNIILLFDYRPGGLDKMTELNSWRRNFVFAGNLYPDLFLATWDGNPTPQLWRFARENQVTQVDISLLETVATFAQGNTGRSMEVRIPWPVFYGETLERRWDPIQRDSVYVLPGGLDEVRSIRVVAILTAGPDGTGGPDSAPDNLGGHTIESSNQVTIDNFAILPLDDTSYVTGDGRKVFVWEESVVDTLPPDSLADIGAGITGRRTFAFTPPFPQKNFTFSSLTLLRPVVSPETGDFLRFRYTLAPEPDSTDVFDRIRGIYVTAEIYDMRGQRVRLLYEYDLRSVVWPGDPERDYWDGRDESGRVVPGGIYLLRFVVEPGVFRTTKAFSVVR